MNNKNLSEMSLEELKKLKIKQIILLLIVMSVGMILIIVTMQYIMGLELTPEENDQKIMFMIIPIAILEMFAYLTISFKLIKIKKQMKKLGWLTIEEKNQKEFDEKLEEIKNMDKGEFEEYKEKTFSQKEVLKPIIAWVIINAIAYFALNLDPTIIETTLEISASEAYSKFFNGSVVILVVFLLIVFLLKQSFSQKIIEKYQDVSEKLK